jgi:RecA-family ATPase
MIEDVITAPGAWCLIGAQKAGKTIFAVQMALSYHVGAAFLENYRMLESRAVLMIEQDDPDGLASLREIIDRFGIATDRERFFTVEHASFVLEDGFIEWLEREIRSRDIGLVVLDSYTAMRATHRGGSDIVKIEANDFGGLDRLAKRAGCVILSLHHDSKTAAGLDWTQRGAGTYAIGMATEGQVYVSRFAELPGTAPERLVQIRGRHTKGLELVIRFREGTLSMTLS